ncbi:hypothetical protein ACLMJK_009247 [Lecanora helva]
MDLVTALGLAANVFQFVDFASKLFSAAYEIHHAGASTANLDVSLVANDLSGLNVNLKSSLKRTDEQIALSEDDQALEVLATECIAIGDDLALRLNKLRIDPRHTSKWRTFRQVLKAIWQDDKINATYKRLENIRSQLAFPSIAKELAQNPTKVASLLDAQTTELRRRHDESDMLAREMQRETLAAINRLQPSASADLMFRPPSPGRQPEEELSPEVVTTMLLNLLKFRQMTARQEDIVDAHAGTFRWLLDESQPNNRRALFSPLLPWLESGRGCYWVSGKAGSGKSTCMKYLGASSAVEQAVKRWAGPNQLIRASFYFWRGGTPLQRTQEGLLRSLLYSILSQRRDLVQPCFPTKFDELRFGVDNESETIPLSEYIKPAFLLLAEMKIDIKIFLYIDGVDEFDGDHSDISSFFMSLTTSPTFKVLLSSRPIAACADTFKTCPSLRLQDLTRYDIQKYVEDTLGRHERMDQLLSENPREASHLRKLILSKASGVFLWVRLVVKSLLDGFRNYDRMLDLESRVNEYPAELGSLYLHMFQNLEIRYQSHAAQLLRIMVQSIAVQDVSPLTVLQMSFADEVSPTQALQAPSRQLTVQERQVRCESIEGRLRSRCWGLLEVVHKESIVAVPEEPDREYYASEVQVLHKSVLDFLAEEEVWTKLLSATPKFDPNSVLMAASLMQVKTLRTAVEVDCNVKHCLAYCQLLEKSTGRAQTPFIEELNRVVCMRARGAVEWDKASDLPYTDVMSTKVPMSPRMLFLASEAGLSQYFDYFLGRTLQGSSSQIDFSFLISRLVSIMTDALRREDSKFALSQDYTTLTIAILNYMATAPSAQAASLLQAWKGTFCSIANVNEVAVNWTEDQYQFDILQSLLSIVQSFLEHGADVNVIRSSDWINFGCEIPTALDILLTWLNQLSDSLAYAPEEYVVLEQQINDLRLELRNREAKHPEKIKQEGWVRWLSSRTSQINSEYTARQQDSKMR